MKKILLILTLLPALLSAQNDVTYLAGAVPEKDGKVVFERDFYLPEQSESEIYENVHDWLDNRISNDKNSCRFILEEKDKNRMVVLGNEYLVFSDHVFSLDKAEMSYYLTVFCEKGKFKIRVERIKYLYEGKRINAEEQISDNKALNKNKTKILPGNKKFRIKTIDFVNKMFDEIKKAFEK
jgi:hypothetical protein